MQVKVHVNKVYRSYEGGRTISVVSLLRRALVNSPQVARSTLPPAASLAFSLPSHWAAAMPGAMVVPLSPTRVMRGGASHGRLDS